MPLIRITKLNGELLRNLPSDMQAELITLDDAIPDGIMPALYANDPFYKKERTKFLGPRDDIREKMYLARGRREELSENDPVYDSVSARINIETDEDIEFVKKYPQFKSLIEGVGYWDHCNLVKFVPIDQYLAEH